MSRLEQLKRIENLFDEYHSIGTCFDRSNDNSVLELVKIIACGPCKEYSYRGEPRTHLEYVEGMLEHYIKCETQSQHTSKEIAEMRKGPWYFRIFK